MTMRWLAASLMAALSLQSWGQSSDRFALTVGQVTSALAEKGISLGNMQVSMLANVVATRPDPLLDVLSVDALSDLGFGEGRTSRSRVKMACHASGTCLPFYILVSEPKSMLNGVVFPSVAAGIKSYKPSLAPTMRPGTHATLLMDDNRAHIEVSVISLENGITGHKIRVASPDHKQFYVGEVIGPNLLRRSF
jgi:hypothetical protein